jgi:hypothetical protein
MAGNLYEDLYTFFIISCSVLLRMKNVSDSNCTENESTYFTFNIFFIENSDLDDSMWTNILQPDRLRKTKWSTPVSCCIHIATNTHTHNM